MSLSSPSMPVPASPAGASPEPRSGMLAAVDVALRVAGGTLAVVGAVVTATWELLLTTARVGDDEGLGVVRMVAWYGLLALPVLVAVAANLALSWFAYRTVGRKWAVALPALVWFTLMVVASGRTAEGDILLTGDNWRGIAMILAGSMSFAIMGFRLILAPRP